MPCMEFDHAIRLRGSQLVSDFRSGHKRSSHCSAEVLRDPSAEYRPCEFDSYISRSKSSSSDSALLSHPPWPFERSQSHDSCWHIELDEALLLLDALAIADRGQLRSTREPEPRPPGGSIVISARAPYTILAASPGLCALLGFSAEEMAQRSVRLLYGPATDPTAIPSAVKRLFAHEACTISSAPVLVVHDCSGAPHAVSVVCTRVPAPRGGGGAAGPACRLRLEWPTAPAEQMTARGPPALPACLWSLV